MITLGTLLILLFVSVLVGKHTQRRGILKYAVIAVLTIIQVGIVLVAMFTMSMPQP